MPDNEGSIEELAGWVALVETIDMVILQLLQKTAFSLAEGRHALGSSGGRYPGFRIEWIFYWIESSQIKIFESNFELNFPGKKIIE